MTRSPDNYTLPFPEPENEPELVAATAPASEPDPARQAAEFQTAEVSPIDAPYDLETALGTPPEPEIPTRRSPARIPSLLDAVFFGLLLVIGFAVSTGALALALHIHLFGLRNFAQAQSNTAVALGTELIIYLVALLGAVPFFRTSWNRDFFSGLQWHAGTAFRLSWRLGIAAILCNLLAILVDQIVPYPAHAPIDKLFSTQTDAWLLFIFGVTVAPFFEEMIFRGFLLPAVASAWDWCMERVTGTVPRPLDHEGNPQWSRAAMTAAAMLISAPFAMMHAEQVNQSLGPLILLYFVSLALCTVRFATRSLAASTLTHSAYNFILFAMMFIQTDGFRHLDKM